MGCLRNSTYDRLWIALAGSTLLHFVGASTLVSKPFLEGARGNGASIPITVRLERVPVAPAVTASAQLQRRPGSRLEPARVLPAPVDPTVYTAGELDSLPVPVTPLDLASTDPVRLELVIDEQGTVRMVSIIGARAGLLRENELRAALAATAFVPARKDGRAVKSRIVLGVQ